MSNWTQSEATAFEARQLKNRPESDTVPSVSESELANQIIDEIARRGWMAFRSNPTMKTGRMRGEPDLEIWASEGRTFHVELKKPKVGKLSTDQLGVIAWGAKLGHVVHIVTSLEQFIEIIK